MRHDSSNCWAAVEALDCVAQSILVFLCDLMAAFLTKKTALTAKCQVIDVSLQSDCIVLTNENVLEFKHAYTSGSPNTNAATKSMQNFDPTVLDGIQ